MTRKASEVVDEVTRELESEIIFGLLHSFETLSEDALMDRFGVKRHVVRQVLANLITKGIVEKQAGRSAHVRFFSAEEVEQIYEMRSHLHALAIKILPLPLPCETLTKLQQYQREHKEAVRRGDLPATHVANDLFHSTLFGACGNRYLVSTIQHYEWLSNPIRSYGIADRSIMSQSIKDHADMIDAISASDRKLLSAIAVRHIVPGKREYLSSISTLTRLAAGADKARTGRETMPEMPSFTTSKRKPRSRASEH